VELEEVWMWKRAKLWYSSLLLQKITISRVLDQTKMIEQVGPTKPIQDM